MGQTAAAIDRQLIPVGFDLSLNVDSLRWITKVGLIMQTYQVWVKSSNINESELVLRISCHQRQTIRYRYLATIWDHIKL